jgi:transposase
MSKLLVPDELWELVEPLLPVPKPRRFRYPGRKPVDNRVTRQLQREDWCINHKRVLA